MVEGLTIVLDGLLLLASPHNFMLYQGLAFQFDFHTALTRIVEVYAAEWDKQGSAEICELLVQALCHLSQLTGVDPSLATTGELSG